MKHKLLLNALAACSLLGFASMPALAAQTDTVLQPAGNPYSPARGHAYRHGVMPNRNVWNKMKQYNAQHALAVFAAGTGTQTLSYGGGVDGIGVMSGQAKVYLVVYGNQWGSQGSDANGNATFSGDTYGAVPVAQNMFKGIGTGGELWSAELTQWCDGPNVASGATSCPSNADFIPYQSGGVYAGIWYDNSQASPSAATATDLANEAIAAAAHFGNTTAASNRNAYYVVLSPTGTNPDNYQGSYCAWHNYTTSSYGDLAYSNQPYNMDSGAGCGVGFVNGSGAAGQLDGYTMTLGHEWHEMMSDQNPAGGWTNHTGDPTYNGQENSDECAWIAAGSPGGAANVTMGNGTYTEQASWSNDTNACAISHAIVGGGNPPPPPPGGGTFSNNTAMAIGDNATINSSIAVSGQSGNAPSTLQVHASIAHNWSGDLTITLIAPDGTSSVLQSPDYANDGNIDKTYTVDASAMPANGTWQLQVSDDDGGSPGDYGTLNSWSVTF